MAWVSAVVVLMVIVQLAVGIHITRCSHVRVEFRTAQRAVTIYIIRGKIVSALAESQEFNL